MHCIPMHDVLPTRFLILYHLSVKPSQRLHISVLTISFCFDDRYDRSFRRCCRIDTLAQSSQRVLQLRSDIASQLQHSRFVQTMTHHPSSHSEPRPVRSTTPSYSPFLPQHSHYFQEERNLTHLVFLLQSLNYILGENVKSSPKVTVGRTGCGTVDVDDDLEDAAYVATASACSRHATN